MSKADLELKDVIFFSIDQCLKRLRSYSTRTFANAGYDLTVDQWLVLKRVFDSNGEVNQTDIAEMLGKDGASVTRILDLLVKKDLLYRQMNEVDRRKFDLVMTPKGNTYVQELTPLVQAIRATALHNVSEAEVLVLRSVLEKIAANMQ